MSGPMSSGALQIMLPCFSKELDELNLRLVSNIIIIIIIFLLDV